MKLLKLSVSRTRTSSDTVTVQKNGRIRISRALAEKLDFKEGEKVDIYVDEEDKRFIYVCKGDMYVLFKHVKGSSSGLYFGSSSMLREIGIDNVELHTLTSKLMKLNKVLYLQLDLSELFPKVPKQMPAATPKKEEQQGEPVFIQ